MNAVLVIKQMPLLQNSAKPYRFNTGLLALPNPCSHLHPLQMNKSNETERQKSLNNTSSDSKPVLNMFLVKLRWQLNLHRTAAKGKKHFSPVNHRSWKQPAALLFPHQLSPAFFYKAWDDGKPQSALF